MATNEQMRTLAFLMIKMASREELVAAFITAANAIVDVRDGKVPPPPADLDIYCVIAGILSTSGDALNAVKDKAQSEQECARLDAAEQCASGVEAALAAGWIAKAKGQA